MTFRDSWPTLAALAIAVLVLIAVTVLCTPVKAGGMDQLCGKASYYGTESGSRTANGEHFDGRSLTAASRSLPFGAKVRVTVTDKRAALRKIRGNQVTVRINDRGPAKWTGRIIDLSRAAAGRLGMVPAGWAQVCLERLR